MSREPRTCRAEDSLATAARILWDNDCGVVPVVDGEGRPVGIVTDRDACMAAYTQGRPLAEIPVRVAMSPYVVSCRADESVAAALQAMREHQVRRLPVLDGNGVLCGLLSIADFVQHAAVGGNAGDVLATLAHIGRSRRAQAERSAAAPSATAKGATPSATGSAATSRNTPASGSVPATHSAPAAAAATSATSAARQAAAAPAPGAAASSAPASASPKVVVPTPPAASAPPAGAAKGKSRSKGGQKRK